MAERPLLGGGMRGAHAERLPSVQGSAQMFLGQDRTADVSARDGHIRGREEGLANVAAASLGSKKCSFLRVAWRTAVRARLLPGIRAGSPARRPTERRPARGVPVAMKEAAGIESRDGGKGPGLGQPQAPCPPAPPWSPVLRGRAGARAARRLWRTPPDRRAQWMGAGRRSDGRTAAAWGRDEGSACGETAVSSRQCADVFGAGQDSRCVCP